MEKKTYKVIRMTFLMCGLLYLAIVIYFYSVMFTRDVLPIKLIMFTTFLSVIVGMVMILPFAIPYKCVKNWPRKKNNPDDDRIEPGYWEKG